MHLGAHVMIMQEAGSLLEIISADQIEVQI